MCENSFLLKKKKGNRSCHIIDKTMKHVTIKWDRMEDVTFKQERKMGSGVKLGKEKYNLLELCRPGWQEMSP